MKTAAILGATGLIGGLLLKRLVATEEYEKIFVLSRHKPEIENSKCEWIKIELEQLSTQKLSADDFFCTIGSTIKKAGSQEKFRSIDFTSVIDFASLAKKTNAKYFGVVSALGANKDSSVFYNRTKGEMEKAIISCKLARLFIFRPSLLIGQRSEVRRGEKIGEAISVFINPFLVGALKKYRPIEAAKVAAAMFQSAQAKGSNFKIYESDEIASYKAI